MKIKPFTFSFIVSLSIAFIFLIATFWIFYKYSWNPEAAKDALSTTGSYFGAAATLGAAIIAAYLFNDWGVIEDHKTKNGHINNAVNTYLQLEEFLKLKTILLRNTQLTLQAQAITLQNRIGLMLDLNEMQIEILYTLRALQTHIQLFATIDNKLILCGNFEQVINDVQTQAKNKLDILLIDLEHSPQSQILISFDEYFKYITGQLIIDLHSKIIRELTKESKALT